MASMAKHRSIFAALFLVSLAGDAAVAGTQPCTDEMAWAKPGSWTVRAEDDDAMADRSYPKAQYPVAFAKADRVVALLKQAIPNLNGVEARSYRTIRGSSYIKNGALKYGVNALFLGYYCVPNTPSFPKVRGQVRLGDETGTWIYIDFNNFSWLANESEMLRHGLLAKDGGVAPYYYFPKQGGEWRGLPLLVAPAYGVRTFAVRNAPPSVRAEAVIIAPEGHKPYRFITRKEYLEARIRYEQKQKGPDLEMLRAALAALTPEERKADAIVPRSRYLYKDKKKIFATEAEGGQRIFGISARFFDKNLPRHAVQFITVYWKWDVGPNNTAKQRVIRQFKENLDVQALRAMLDR